MKHVLSHLLSALLGAVITIALLIGLDQASTLFPIYVPNIFYKERIDYYVNVESAVSKAIDTANEHVVSISNYQNGRLVGTGSGVIYDVKDGNAFIVTNYHVVENANRIEIKTASGYVINVNQIVGTDEMTDLAVLTIPQGEIKKHIEIADSQALKKGEFVIAIGNPLGLEESSTFGIISSLNRLISIDSDDDGRYDWYANVIQTDAAINPGNSGGALINLDGKLVGINSMKIADAEVEGIGFSIPSNQVMKIIADLETHGKVIRPFLGIQYITISSMNRLQKIQYGINLDHGLYLASVNPSSSAEKQGLLEGDIILEVNDHKIYNDLDFMQIIYQAEIGETVSIDLLRNGKEINLAFELENN
jgi:serine protease Do